MAWKWSLPRCRWNVLVMITLLTLVNGREERASRPRGSSLQVVTRHFLDGAQRAVTEADQELLLRECLGPDIANWTARARSGSGPPLRSTAFLDLLTQIDRDWMPHRKDFVAIVAVVNNEFRYWAYPSARSWCIRRVTFALKEFKRVIKSHGLVFPNTVFIMNGYDKPLCLTPALCAAPIFSFTKHAKDGVSPHVDILMPVMNHPFEHLGFFPWEHKDPRAFMRAGMYAAMSATCSRVRLHRLSRTSLGRTYLDVGITENRHWKVKVKAVPRVPMDEHAKWRYLISADGQAASWKLAKLLSLNSVVLKHTSPSVEHYYRALKPWMHYVPMNVSSLISVVQNISNQDARMQQISAAAQRFAFTYLSQASRVVYARRALQEYTALFSDMDRLVAALPTNFTLQSILSLRATLANA